MNNLTANGNFIKWNKDNKDFYETVNTFSGNKKRSDKIFELMNLYLDIDFKLSNIEVDINDEKQIYNYIDLLVGRCRELKIPDPSQINFSGNGLHVYWFVDKVNDFNNEGKKLFGSNAKACKKFYLNLENELVKNFQDLGADNNAKDLSRVLRVVGTSNSKNGRVCKSIYHDDKTYKLDEFAHLLKYNYDEYQEFVNQPTTDKQLELAKVLDIKVSDKKLVAHKQIAKAIQGSKVDDKKTCKNVKSNRKDYVLNYLTNYYSQGYFKRGNGITNNYMYYLGIGCKRAGISNLDNVFDKCKVKLKLKECERNEMYNTLISGYMETGNALKVSYKKLNEKLKVEEDILDRLKLPQPARKRATKQLLVKVYRKIEANRVYRFYSCRQLAKRFNISKSKANEILNQIKDSKWVSIKFSNSLKPLFTTKFSKKIDIIYNICGGSYSKLYSIRNKE